METTTAWAFLAASLLALALGPLPYHLARPRGAFLAGLDGFVLVSLLGLVLLHLLPESLALAGWAALLALLLGMLAPSAIERAMKSAAAKVHTATMALALAGLCLHAVVDGLALTPGLTPTHEGGVMLALGIVLHRLPAGMLIWALLRPRGGRLLPVATLGAMSIATVVGFSFGDSLRHLFATNAVALFQAFVAGSLLHVILHDERSANHARHGPRNGLGGGIGGLSGILLLALMTFFLGGHGACHGGHHHHGLGSTFVALALQSAPALLFGYLAAGLIAVFIPPGSVRFLTRGGGFSRALRGTAFGLPLPVCSCGVVPMYRSLILRGTPPTAALAFLIATPELGIDAVSLSLPLLGVSFTVARLISAAALALLVGWLLGRLIPTTEPTAPPTPLEEQTGASEAGFFTKLRLAFRTGLDEVAQATAPWVLLGLLVASFATPLLEGGALTSLSRWVDVPLFALIGLPAYVCATGSAPLVAILLLQGISPGAAIAFLLTGPASNVSTFGLLRDLHGRRVAFHFVLAMAAGAIALGYLTNIFLPAVTPLALEQMHHDGPAPWKVVSLVFLTLAMLRILLLRGPRALIEVIVPPHQHLDDEPGHSDSPPTCCSQEPS